MNALVLYPDPERSREQRATRLPNGLWLRPGQECWEDAPHRLAARVRAAMRRGEIYEVGRWAPRSDRHAAIVVRLRPRPSRRRIAALWCSGAGVAAAAAGVGTWWVATHLVDAAIATAALLLTASALALLTRVLSGHRAACVGLHCPGCRH